jgi:prephenate dehydratase
LRPRRTVAFQGDHGAFSEEAVGRLWRSGVETVPRRELLDVARAVDRGEVQYGILPVHNTVAGRVAESWDALARCAAIHVVGEVVLPIHQCLLVLPGATLDGLRSVASHSVALAQCGQFLRRLPQLDVRAAYDTAGAAREVAARGDLTAAAIAGRAAAARYGLHVVAADIEDRPDNHTRFLAIARQPSAPPDGTPARTMLLVRPDEPPSHRVFLEMEHTAGDGAPARAIEAMRAAALSLRVLGCFARWSPDGAPER